MKVLIVYDSVYGNTQKIAKAIGGAITGEVKILRAAEVNPSELESIDLLIVGSPPQGGRPTPAIQDFLSRVLKPTKGVNVATFDTRFSTRWVGIFGYAAGRIASIVRKKGDSYSITRRLFRKGQRRSFERGRTGACCQLGERDSQIMYCRKQRELQTEAPRIFRLNADCWHSFRVAQ